VRALLPEIAGRKSVRAFSSKAVGAEKLALLFEAARWAPSSYNRQPWRLIVVTDPTVRARVHGALMSGNRWAERAPVLLVLTSRPDADDVRHDSGLPYYLL
jgi:nitroreductase